MLIGYNSGPCTIKDDPKSVNDTKVNPYSWNDKVSRPLLPFDTRANVS